MTTLRSSQLGAISVNGGTGKLNASQLATVAVAANPAAVGLRVSQLFTVAVIANNRSFKPLGPVIGLNCWTPCGTLLYNGV
jgi:hypothetical protein